MRFIIHGEHSDGSDDSLVISGTTIEEIQAIAEREADKRGWKNCWSEDKDCGLMQKEKDLCPNCAGIGQVNGKGKRPDCGGLREVVILRRHTKLPPDALQRRM